eukprot:gene8923-1265_t
MIDEATHQVYNADRLIWSRRGSIVNDNCENSNRKLSGDHRDCNVCKIFQEKLITPDVVGKHSHIFQARINIEEKSDIRTIPFAFSCYPRVYLECLPVMSSLQSPPYPGSAEHLGHQSQTSSPLPVAEIAQASPFPHQVGGHSPCVRVKESNLVCKPAQPKEQKFYENYRPALLAPFLPKYHGCTLVEFPPLSQEHDACPSSADNSDDVQSTDSAGGISFSDWGERCYNLLLSKCQNHLHDCIILEDLTSKFRRPCILDLKMGRRTHSDFASERKVRRHMEKAQKTTTAALGLRVCGLKVYAHSTKNYIVHDKYEGRALNRQNIGDCISMYFTACPPEYKQEFIHALLKRLEQLRAAICQTPNYRFYSSSLLLVYDACPSHSQLIRRTFSSLVDLRMIDFANTSCYFEGADEVPIDTDPNTIDEGYIFGLDNLHALLVDEIQRS